MIRLFAVSLSMLIFLSVSIFARESLLVGYADTDITPSVGEAIPGYFQHRISAGVLDPLLAKVLVLTKEQTTLVIVALDLLSLEAQEVQGIRQEIQQRTQIPPEHVFVHCTHTHSGARGPYRAKQLFFCNLTESDLRSDSPVV